MIEGQMKAIESYLSNAKHFAEAGDLERAKDNLIWMRDEVYDALVVLGEKGNDKSKE